MASRPGLLTHWPWEKLGNFKYVILTPWVAHSLYTVAKAKDWSELDITYLINLPALLLRMLHNQLWISYSHFQNARSRHRIVDKPIEFEQVDRESNWDDLILFNGILFYISYNLIPIAKNLPWWRTDGFLIIIVTHAGPVEFLYYWFHRALHHHYLYSRYHSHHHASIVTEPITSVIHPFAEHIVYFLLFSFPLFTSVLMGKGSLITIIGYMLYIDFMNNMGHCNFELVPKWCFQVVPPLKYLMYTPSYHSLHHTQFRTNYSLFMPIYDYMYHTMDKSTDTLYESSLKGKDDIPQVVHLTHLTTLQSIYHLRLGFASLASKPYSSKWYIMLMCPVTWVTILLTWIFGSTFIVEKNNLKKIKMQTWVIPRFSFQYNLAWQREIINDLIEKSILEAEEKGVEVLSLGLINMAKDLNGGSELYIQKYPKLRLKIIDGSSLMTALVLNNIPDGTKQVLLQGNPVKVARALAQALYKRGVQVMMTKKHEYHMLKSLLSESIGSNLILSSNYNPQVWLIGDGLDDEDQNKALTGTHLIPFSQFPLKKLRKECTYYTTPAMKIPTALENVHSCENWLPRRVMSASRITGIIHALEGWNTHECGDFMLDVEKIWSSALNHGFIPLTHI